MSEKVEKLLARLGNIWPKRINEETLGDWISDWETALKSYDGWVIDAAATRMIASRTKPGYPFPGEVAEVCRQIIAEDRRGKPELLKASQPANPYKLADELIRGQLGKRAAREGWAITLHDFIRDNGRLPNEYETSRLVAVRDAFLENLNSCLNGQGGLLGRDLARLGKSMVEREHRYAATILGREAPLWYAGKISEGVQP